MPTAARSDVVVVGAGPSGALAALGLAQRGCRVTVLDAEPEIVPSPRALVYYWHVLDGLERLGVLEDLDEAGFRNRTFLQRVPESGRQEVVSLERLAAVAPHPHNLHLGQHEVVRIVLAHLARHQGATLVRGARVTEVRHGEPMRVVASVDGEEVEYPADWVIGADGARSAVRAEAGLGFGGLTWPDRFVATNLTYPFDRLGGLGDANLLLDPEHGCVVVRIDREGLFRWTWSESADLPEATIGARLPDRLAGLGFGDAEYEVTGLTPYRMHQRHVETMRSGRILVVGDAAHATNPTGGLGLTSGVYDVLALVDPLASVVHGRADDRVLSRWADDRLTVFRDQVSPIASGLKHVVYDEPSLTAREAFVEHAGGRVDADRELQRLLGPLSLRTALPRHHAEL